MLVASFSLPPETLALEETMERIPQIELETERIAAHSTKWVMPCLWVSNAELDDVEAAFESDPTVDEIVKTEHFDEEAFFHVEWADVVEHRINEFLDKEASILNAQVEDGRWNIRIRFATREQFEAFREYLTDQNRSFQLLTLAEPDEPHEESEDITATQREALVTAAELGYYRVPREITASELASELETSHQAVSELLRRGTENLICSTLTSKAEIDER